MGDAGRSEARIPFWLCLKEYRCVDMLKGRSIAKLSIPALAARTRTILFQHLVAALFNGANRRRVFYNRVAGGEVDLATTRNTFPGAAYRFGPTCHPRNVLAMGGIESHIEDSR